LVELRNLNTLCSYPTAAKGTALTDSVNWHRACVVETGSKHARKENHMKIMNLLLASAIGMAGITLTAGCDDTVAKKETTVKRDGETVAHDKVEVKKDADGNLKKEEVHEQRNP
jgi:hypothetical protein